MNYRHKSNTAFINLSCEGMRFRKVLFIADYYSYIWCWKGASNENFCNQINIFEMFEDNYVEKDRRVWCNLNRLQLLKMIKIRTFQAKISDILIQTFKTNNNKISISCFQEISNFSHNFPAFSFLPFLLFVFVTASLLRFNSFAL